jgi:hypothetical protein
MLPTTYDAIKAILRADPSLPLPERNHVLGLLRSGPEKAKPETTGERVPRIIRRAEVAQRLSCSLRTVDGLAASGVLKKRKLPGRVRASGFLEGDVAALIAG